MLFIISSVAAREEFSSCKLENLSKKEQDACLSNEILGHGFTKAAPLISKLTNNTTEQDERKFKEALRKEVDFLFEAKIYEVKLMKNCAASDFNSIRGLNKELEIEKIEEQCQTLLKERKDKIQNNYSNMRVALALSKPQFKENRISRDTSTWYSARPKHIVSTFSAMPPLSDVEHTMAQSEYLSMLDKASADEGMEKLSKIIKDKNIFNVGYEVGSKTIAVLSSVEKQRKQKQQEYSATLFATPELGYVSTSKPNNSELFKSYEMIENSLIQAKNLFSKNVENPSNENWNAHFNLKPLIESLLKRNPSWCAIAMKISQENESKERWDIVADVGFSILAGLPCLVAGPLGAAACIGLGLEIGRVGINNAEEATQRLLGKNLLGDEFVNIQELSEAEKQSVLQKIFLPLAVWGGVAKGGAVVSERLALKKVGSQGAVSEGLTEEAAKIPVVSKVKESENITASVAPKETKQMTTATVRDQQTELWALKESSDPKKAKIYEEKLRKKIKTLPMKEVKKFSDSAEGARLMELSDGTKVVWKPIRDAQGLTEVASYEVDQVLGLNQVPVTMAKSFEGQKGVVQVFVNNTLEKANPSYPTHFKMFDYLIGNIDRRSANYLVTTDRRTVAIDNGMSFNSERIKRLPNTFKNFSEYAFKKLDEIKKNGSASYRYIDHKGVETEKILNEKGLREEAKSLFSSMTVNKQVYEKLKQTTDAQWRQSLQGLISSEQMKGFLERRDEIINTVERARRVFGEEVLLDRPYSPVFNQEVKKFN